MAPALADQPCSAANFMTGCAASTASQFEGAILVPGSEAANRAVAASGGCAGCEWTLVRECDLNTPHDPNYVNCLASRCPDGTAYRLYLKRPEDEAPVLLDTICVSEARRIVTAAELAVDVARHVKRLVPPTHTVVVERPGYAVTRLAAYFSASGPGNDTATLTANTAAGPARLDIDVGPREYAWSFGDGGTCRTANAGGAWDGDRTGAERCDTRVAHVYRATGDRVVTLTVTWGGTYTFDVGYGPVGPLAIPGDGVVAPVSTRTVAVREARAELVGG
ncbi:MAG TPA: hypothetical protein VF519_09565 [Mycobacteriales bacterium]